jgi:signal transduction histidine kinase
VRVVNAAFERICDKPRDAMLCLNFWELFPQASDPSRPYWSNYRRCMVERVEVTFDSELTSSEAWLEIHAYPLDDGGIAVVFRDVSEVKRLLRVAQIAQEQAADANRTKDELLSTVSHELRTPLNAIVGWIQLLRGGQLDANAAERAVETIERNARSQVRLIEDIFDSSRILAGKLHLEIRPLDPAAVVRAALDAVLPAAQAKQIRVSVSLDSAAGTINGDPDRLQQVLWNLANNAIKFTPKGGYVEVTLKRAGVATELSIADSGQGIDSAFLPHVFERYRQAECSISRRHGGLGLGLALERHLVEAHGGTVTAESAGQGCGARFVVVLPA